jgi:hypothetical protein
VARHRDEPEGAEHRVSASSSGMPAATSART